MRIRAESCMGSPVRRRRGAVTAHRFGLLGRELLPAVFRIHSVAVPARGADEGGAMPGLARHQFAAENAQLLMGASSASSLKRSQMRASIMALKSSRSTDRSSREPSLRTQAVNAFT